MNEFIILVIFTIILALYFKLKLRNSILGVGKNKNKNKIKNWLDLFINNPNYSIRVDANKPNVKNIEYSTYYKFTSNKQRENINYQLDQFNVSQFEHSDPGMYITVYISKENRNVNLARLVLCKESLNFCKYQDLNKFKSLYDDSIVKKYADIYHKLPVVDQEKLILISGSISLLLGLRQATDIDLYTLEIGDRLCNKFKNFNLDCSYQIDSKLRNMVTSVVVNSVMYVNGIKCYSLKEHLDYRLTFRSPNKYAELIYINYYMPDIFTDYKIPKLKLHDYMGYYKKIEPDGSLYVKEIVEHLYNKFKKLNIRKDETDAYEKYKQPANKKRIAKNTYRYLHTKYQFPKDIKIPILEEALT